MAQENYTFQTGPIMKVPLPMASHKEKADLSFKEVAFMKAKLGTMMLKVKAY